MDDFTNNTPFDNTASGIDSSDMSAASTSRMVSTSRIRPDGRHLRAVSSTTSSAGWDGADLSDEALSEKVAGLAGRISAATCEWLGYVAEADRRGVWSGFASCAAWLSWRCGLGLGTAADQIRVARALVDLPVIRSHFASGSLSYSQVRALIRGAGLIPEDELVDLARHATGAQLERLVRALRRVASDEDEQAAANPAHVSAESTAGISAESPSNEAGPSIHWETTGAAASIITLAAVLHHAQIDLIARLNDGTLVDLGRSRRRPSARLARTVLRRHGDRCAHPHCRAKAYLHLHHVQPWSKGGATSAANLIPLCGRHHRALHRGEFHIVSRPTAAAGTATTATIGTSAASFMFVSATGRPLAAVAGNHTDNTRDPIATDVEYASAGRAGRDITTITNRAERLNLGYAVGVLLHDRR